MPEPIKKDTADGAKETTQPDTGQEAGAGEDKPVVDAFGAETPADPADKKEEEKKGKEGDEKKFEAIPTDHPIIEGLQNQITQLTQDKGSMGTNLSKQGDIIKTLEKKVGELKEGKKGDETDVLFKDIKWSKDLKQDEKDEMTDTEVKQMDQIAEMQTAQNKLDEIMDEYELKLENL